MYQKSLEYFVVPEYKEIFKKQKQSEEFKNI